MNTRHVTKAMTVRNHDGRGIHAFLGVPQATSTRASARLLRKWRCIAHSSAQESTTVANLSSLPA